MALIGIDLLERLLGVPENFPPWRIASVAARARILETWLSLAETQGLELSESATEHLARARRRANELHRIGAEQAAAHNVTVIKGGRIAAYLPKGMLRQSGDVDLVAADEESLWRCVTDLMARHEAIPQGVSVLEHEDGRHLCVALKWPAEEPHLDKPMGADISTCAFMGDLKGVPYRSVPPEQDDLCGLFCVAEERFQRKYRIKDLIDFLILAGLAEALRGDAMTEAVCQTADELALAPELRALARKAGQYVELSDRWLETLARLDALAALEKERRHRPRRGVLRLRYGFPLNSTPGAEPRIRIHRSGGDDVATTPIGSCLLTAEPLLDPDAVAKAINFADSLGRR